MMTQIFTGTGLGSQGSSLGQLGNYGPKNIAGLGQGGESVYVNAANGNLLLKQSDGFLAGMGLGFELSQFYNAMDGNWRFNSQTSLQFNSDSQITRIDEDGHDSHFSYDAGSQSYRAADGSNARIKFTNGHWQYSQGSGERVCNYNNEGQITSINDRDGHCLTFFYEDGHISKITDSSGKQTINWLFKDGLLQDVTCISDAQVIYHLHYDYDAQGRLNRVSRDMGDGKVYWIAYEYLDDSNLITDIRQSDGVNLHINYDEQGRVKQLIDGEGRSTIYDYIDGATRITNDKGESWLYHFDTEAHLTSIDGPAGFHASYRYENNHLTDVIQGEQHWHFTYNEQGDCIAIEEPSGQIIKRSYDDEHRLLDETRYQRFDGTHHPEKPLTKRLVYDSKGHLRFAINTDGTVTEYRYNNQGLCTSKRLYLREKLNLLSNQAISLDEINEWARNQPEEVIALTDYHYDWRGQLTEEIVYDKDKAISLITYTRYNAAGQLIEKSTPWQNSLSTTYYFYDDLGRLIKTVDNQNHTQTFFYDDEHQHIVETDAHGLQTTTTYDKSGLVLCQQKTDKNHNYGQIKKHYDSVGRLIAETAVDGKTAYFFYDAEGRLKARVSISGQVSEFDYDVQNHCIRTHNYQQLVNTKDWLESLPDYSEIRPKTTTSDRINQSIYNQYQQLVYEINAQGYVIAYQYDAENRLISKTAYATRLTAYQPDTILTCDIITLVTSTNDRQMYYYYDERGQLIAQINGEGSATSYRYDAWGNVLEVCRYATKAQLPPADNWNDSTPLASPKDIHNYNFYNNAGLKIASLDAGNYLTEYHYDQRGLLINKSEYYMPCDISNISDLESLRPEQTPKDHWTKYRYNDLNQLVEEQTQNGLVTNYVYNDQGLLVEKNKTDTHTNRIRQQYYRYDALGRIIQSLDEAGVAYLRQHSALTANEVEQVWQKHGVHYEYNIAGQLICKTNSLMQSTRYFYNDVGLLTYTVNADGAISETHYNSFNQIEKTIRYSARFLITQDMTTAQLSDHILVLANPSQDELISYEYNVAGLLSCTKQSHGKKVEITYNAFSEQESIKQSINSSHFILSNYDYDRTGLLRHRTDDVKGINKSQEWVYDEFGRLVKEIDAQGNARKYVLGKRGEIQVISKPVGNKRLFYDAYGRMNEATSYAGGQIAESYDYDDVTNTLTVTIGNSKVKTKFNAFGDKISVTDANGNVTNYEYDDKGQLIQCISAENKSKTYEYDSEGHLSWQQDAAGHSIRYTYDAEGHVLTQRIDPQGLNITTTMTYDGIGRQLTVTDPAHGVKQFKYNNEGQLIKIIQDEDGLNLITEFEYDDQGLLLRKTEINQHGKNKITAYEWDGLGRSTAVIVDPDGLHLATHYQYDNNNNMIGMTDPNGHSIHYVYDANNRRTYTIDSRGVVTFHKFDFNDNEEKTITYANRLSGLDNYDEASVINALKPDSKRDQYHFYRYDLNNRVIFSFDALGYATHYTYDANGNLTAKTQYADPCSLEKLKQGDYTWPALTLAARVTHFAYDGLNQERYRVDANGQTTASYYDAAGQLIRQTRFHTLLQAGNTNYTIDIIEENLKTDTKYDQTTHYAYDLAGRVLANISGSGAITTYQYDASGHVIARRQHENTLDYALRNTENWFEKITYSRADRITRSVFDAAGRESYRISPTGHVVERIYDDADNVIAEIAHYQQVQLNDYSLEQLQTTLGVRSSRDHMASYHYDENGRLLDKTDANLQKTSYVYDNNGNLISKTDANKAIWKYTYNESNQLIDTISPAISISRWRNDQLVRTTRSVITRNSYDSFGNIISVIRDVEGLAQTVNYEYDNSNRKIKTLYPKALINTATANQSSIRQEESKTVSESIIYNAFGDIIASSDKRGHWRHFAYDNSEKLIFSLDNEGYLSQFGYDAFGNLKTKAVYASRPQLPADFDYTSDAYMKVRQLDSLRDRCESYSYDTDNRLIETSKAPVRIYNHKTGFSGILSPLTRLSYNAFNELVTTSLQLNETDWAVTTNFYDDDGLKTAVIDAEHYLTSYEYNAFGQLQTETQYAIRCKDWTASKYNLPAISAKDRCVGFAYDALGQLISKTLKQVTYQRLSEKGSRYENITADLTSYYSYDAMGHLIATSDPQGNTALSYYDDCGNLIAKVSPQTQKGRTATTFSYDSLGELVETHRWINGAQEADETHFLLNNASTDDIVTQDVYDNNGHVLQQRDGNLHATYFSYDENGNVARSWQMLTSINGVQQIRDSRYSYDKENHLIQTATIKNNNQWRTDDALYNAFGEVCQKGINGNLNIHMDYDNVGRLWRSNTQGHYQIYVYDLTNNVTMIVRATDAFFALHNKENVDLSNAEVAGVIDFTIDRYEFAVHRQYNRYDALGHLVSQSNDSIFNINQNKFNPQIDTLQQEVDRWGNVLLQTNAMHHTTRFEYNAFNQITRQELPALTIFDKPGSNRLVNPVIQYAYDELGRAIAMLDANNHSVGKRYDAEGHVIQEIDARGNHRDKTWNLFGQLNSSTNEKGWLTTYVYDKESRLIKIQTPTTNQKYSYDEAGQLIMQTDGMNNSSRYWYDELGNQTIRQDPDSKYNYYAYDDEGHKIAEKDANNRSQSWVYDENGRLKDHVDLGGHQTHYIYNSNGLLVEETSLTSQKKHVYTYFSNGKLKQYSDENRQEVVNYDYYDDGSLKHKDSSRLNYWVTENDDYSYDALGQLNDVSRHDTNGNELLTIHYDYDSAGNIRHTIARANYADHQAIKSDDYFTYDENNRILINKGIINSNGDIDIGEQSSGQQYDEAGNISQVMKYEHGVLQTHNYLYNKDNQLEIVRKNGIDLQTKKYDSAGRLEKEVLYNSAGYISEIHELEYQNNKLFHQTTRDALERVVSKTVYGYDDVNNLTHLETHTYDPATGIENSVQTHDYVYEAWDNYQQQFDYAKLNAQSGEYYGKSERFYDVNDGQLNRMDDRQLGSNSVNHSTQYRTSSLDGVRDRYDSAGQTSYLNIGGKVIGDLQLNNDGTQHLNVYSGFTPAGNASTETFLHGNEAKPAETVSVPDSPQNSLGSYTIEAGDTLENIALQVYGDSSLWYLLADANGITERAARGGEKGSQLNIGQRLIIPPLSRGQHHTNSTHRVLTSDDILGNISATINIPPTAPPQRKNNNSLWRVLAKIVIGVAAMAATVISAGALIALSTGTLATAGLGSLFTTGLSVLGGTAGINTAATMGASFAAGFIGNIAAQGAANAFGLQHGLDLKSALISALSSAAIAGAGSALTQTNAYKDLAGSMKNFSKSFNINSAVEMMERDAITQTANLALRNHQHFDWLELATTGISAGLLSGLPAEGLKNRLNNILPNSGTFASSELGALGSSAMTAAANNTHLDASQVLADNLGNAVGGSVIESVIEPINFNQDIDDSLNLTDTVLDAIHPERTADAVYSYYLAEKLAGNGYDGLQFFSDDVRSQIFNEINVNDIDNIPLAPKNNMEENLDFDLSFLGKNIRKYYDLSTAHPVWNELVGPSSLVPFVYDIKEFIASGAAANLHTNYNAISNVKGGWDGSKTVYRNFYPQSDKAVMMFKNADGSLSTIHINGVVNAKDRFNNKVKPTIINGAKAAITGTLRSTPMLSVAGEALDYGLSTYYKIPGKSFEHPTDFAVDIALDIPKMAVSSGIGAAATVTVGSVFSVAASYGTLGAFGGPAGVAVGFLAGLVTGMVVSYGIEKVYSHYQLRENIKYKFRG